MERTSRMPGYDQSLARQILLSLDQAFPTTLSFPELKVRIPQSAHIDDRDWLLALDALRKLGFLDGHFSLLGFKKVLKGAANLIITAAGRQDLRETEARSKNSARSEADRMMFETTGETYTIEAMQGEGSNGIVYKTLDSAGKPWAVKCLKPDQATSKRIKRFLNELTFCQRSTPPQRRDCTRPWLRDPEGQEVSLLRHASLPFHSTRPNNCWHCT